jgi:hypothetical protein
MSKRNVIEETYLIGKEVFNDYPKWDNLPDYDKLSVPDLDEVFKLLMGLLSLVGITNNTVNDKGRLIEECIDFITERRLVLQKDPKKFESL